MTAPEFSRPVRIDTIGERAARRSTIEADAGRARGARRAASAWSRSTGSTAEARAEPQRRGGRAPPARSRRA